MTFLPSMISKESGHIITIASTASIIGVSYLTDYCGSKFGCRGLHESLHIELKELGLDKGIILSSVMPYFIKTGMFKGCIPSKLWIATKLGFDYLEPEYVAHQIIRVIQYDIREAVIPNIVSLTEFTGRYFMPYWLADYLLITAGPELKNFIGKNGKQIK